MDGFADLSFVIRDGIVLFMSTARSPLTLRCVRQSSQVESTSGADDDLDPRVARSRAAVISAATELLVEAGPGAVTIDAIVARSGVAKSTIYRHWTSRDEVLLDVMEVCAPDLVAPDPALGVEAGLRETGHRIGVMLNDPEWARVLPALLMLKNHAHGIADLDKRMEERQHEV